MCGQENEKNELVNKHRLSQIFGQDVVHLHAMLEGSKGSKEKERMFSA